MCFLFAEDSILMMQRTKIPNLGKWVPPGGKLMPNELPMNACIREIQEETGLLIQNPSLLGVLTEVSPIDYNWITYIYCKKVARFQPIVTSEGVPIWIPLSELDKYELPTIDYHFIQNVIKGKRFAISGQYDSELQLISHHIEWEEA